MPFRALKGDGIGGMRVNHDGKVVRQLQRDATVEPAVVKSNQRKVRVAVGARGGTADFTLNGR